MKNQKQESGDNSTNTQIGQVTVYTGLTYSDVREISLDVMKGEIAKLTEEAAQTGRKRLESYADQLLDGVQKSNIELLQKFNDPAIQLLLHEAGTGYLKTGDSDFAQVTIDLLIDRMGCEGRDRMSLVLDDALSKVNKLTAGDLDLLSLIFILVESRREDLTTDQALQKFVRETILPFSTNPSSSNTAFKYLVSLGCLSLIPFSNLSLSEMFKKSYPGLFARGFNDSALEKLVGNYGNEVIIPCLNNNDLKQVRALNEHTIENWLLVGKIISEDKAHIMDLLMNHLLGNDEVEAKIIRLCPEMQKVFEYWNKNIQQQIVLSGTGIVLAQANIRKKIGHTHDLSIWVQE